MATDTEAPKLKSFHISPIAVDTAYSAQTVSWDLVLSDDLSGPSRADVDLWASGDFLGAGVDFSGEKTKGGYAFSGQIEIERYSETGVLRIGVTTWDEVGNHASYDNVAYAFNAPLIITSGGAGVFYGKTYYVGASKTLAAKVENLFFTGTGGFTGKGNALDNDLFGNIGNNRLFGLDGDDRLLGKAGNDILDGGLGADELNGGIGADRLFGGKGADAFIFDVSPKQGVDTIEDFQVTQDVIRLDDDVFKGIGAVGDLSVGAFRTGTAALDATDRVIYDRRTGDLWFDADGKGAGKAVLFAEIDAGLNLKAIHFEIVA